MCNESARIRKKETKWALSIHFITAYRARYRRRVGECFACGYCRLSENRVAQVSGVAHIGLHNHSCAALTNIKLNLPNAHTHTEEVLLGAERLRVNNKCIVIIQHI